MPNGFIVIRYDGKIIQLMSGYTEDRLAIALSAPNHISGQSLASPVIPDGTGESMANCVHNTLQEFGLLEKVEALVFDTPGSNTGRWKGSVTFEKMFNRALFWLACRHHIPELFNKRSRRFFIQRLQRKKSLYQSRRQDAMEMANTSR